MQLALFPGVKTCHPDSSKAETPLPQHMDITDMLDIIVTEWETNIFDTLGGGETFLVPRGGQPFLD